MTKSDINNSEDPVALIEMLRFQLDAGIDATLSETPVDHLSATLEIAALDGNTFVAQGSDERADDRRKTVFTPARPLQKGTSTGSSDRPAHATPALIPSDDSASIQNATTLAASAETLDQLKEALEDFDGCALKKTAKNLVFADGNSQAAVMFVGEAPGRDEDLSGKPFVGRAGQLLDKMLGAIGLDRTSAYITNVIPWRPPGNRDPSSLEVAVCLPFIERHIALARPKILVTLGNASTKTLLQTSTGILRMRGKWHEYADHDTVIPTMATLHPAYLLRQSGQKRLAWQDLLKVQQALSAPGGK